MEEGEKIDTPSENGGEPGDGQPSPPPENGGSEEQPLEVSIGLSMDEYEAMQQELSDARAAAEKNLEGWQRTQADYNNLRRRTEQERESMRADMVGKILNPFLDVLDDLDLAVRSRPEDGGDQGWSEGIELVYRKLLGRLEAQGVRVMDADGAAFDPHFHEAITHEDDPDYESGQIIAVVKPGYMIGERVLRPAMVRVAA